MQKNFNAIHGKGDSVRAVIDVQSMAASVGVVFETQEFPADLVSTVFAVKNYQESTALFLMNYFGYRIRSLNDAMAISVVNPDGSPKSVKDVLRVSMAGNPLVELKKNDLLILTHRDPELEFTAVYHVGDLTQVPTDIIEEFQKRRPHGNIYADHIGIEGTLVGIRAVQRVEQEETEWVGEADDLDSDAVRRMLKTYAPSALYDAENPLAFVPMIAPRSHFNNVATIPSYRTHPGEACRELLVVDNPEPSTPAAFISDLYNFMEELIPVMHAHIDVAAVIRFEPVEDGSYNYHLKTAYGRLTGSIIFGENEADNLLTETDLYIPAHQDARLISPLFMGAETWNEFVTEFLVPNVQDRGDVPLRLGILKTNVRKDTREHKDYGDFIQT